MSLPIRFLAAARGEFDADYDWCEGQQAGLGERFADQVERVLNRIAVMPQLHAKAQGEVRRAVVPHFPYCVYYREESKCVRVLSVFHTSRDPNVWQRRA